jgi:DNA-binding transcriptional ArsR family regulator
MRILEYMKKRMNNSLRPVVSYQAETQMYQALAHPVRLTILDVLRRDEECVCHLTALFGRPQAYISQQLAVLREAGLVLDRKDGQRTFYRLADRRLGEVLDQVRSLAGNSDTTLDLVMQADGRVPNCECPKCST